MLVYQQKEALRVSPSQKINITGIIYKYNIKYWPKKIYSVEFFAWNPHDLKLKCRIILWQLDTIGNLTLCSTLDLDD